VSRRRGCCDATSHCVWLRGPRRWKMTCYGGLEHVVKEGFRVKFVSFARSDASQPRLQTLFRRVKRSSFYWITLFRTTVREPFAGVHVVQIFRSVEIHSQDETKIVRSPTTLAVLVDFLLPRRSAGAPLRVFPTCYPPETCNGSFQVDFQATNHSPSDVMQMTAQPSCFIRISCVLVLGLSVVSLPRIFRR